MDTKHGERVSRETPQIVEEQLARLKDIFPEAFSEGKVDFEKLRATLGDVVDDGPERYTFNWAGKRDAIRLLQTPSRATLVPCREESVDFDSTQHLFIEGDNLEVLKLLYKPYYGRVKMIYIDPPYNTGNDFIYPDNYADPLATYLQLTGQQDAEGNLLTSNPETSGRYHSAWLSMMYPRLFLARQLLRDDGLIFVSIDDRESHNLRLLMNEVFGESSFIGVFVWQSKKGGGSDTTTAVHDHEYVLCFGRTNIVASMSRIVLEAVPLDRADVKGAYRRGRELNKWGAGSRREDRPTMYFPIPGPNGEDVYPIRNDGTAGRWRWGREKMLQIVQRGDVEFVERFDGTYIAYEKVRSTDPRHKPYRTWLADVGTTADGSRALKDLFDGHKVYDFPKPVALLKHLVSTATVEDQDIVVDFFAGSCTTAQAVLELDREDGGNRCFIVVQLPEPTAKGSPARQAGYDTIADIGKERIRRVIAKMNQANEGQLPLETRETPEDLGFKVFKLAPSNYRSWSGVGDDKPDAYAQQMDLFTDPLVDGWSAEDVIYEVALKEGYGLNCRIEPVPSVEGNTVQQVSDPDKEQSFYICLDRDILLSSLTPLNLDKEDVFICRDVALDDEAAANLALQCRLKTI
ncbi:MAG: site-specific DNA-methyltransferase [Chloroflexota bacterium]|nr:site-specific DNA-methyltransferase [Anaerolineae bacterium]